MKGTSALGVYTLSDYTAATGLDAIYIPFHDSSGAVATERLGVLTVPTLTVDGTTAGIWGTAGSLTCAGDNRITLAGEAVIDNLFNMLDIAANGQSFIWSGWCMLPTGVPASGSEVAWGYGVGGASKKGLRCQFRSAALDLLIGIAMTDAAATTRFSVATYSADTWTHFGVHFDLEDGVFNWDLYVDGASGNSGTEAGKLLGVEEHGATLLAGNDAAGAAALPLGNTAQVSDWVFARVPGGKSSEIASFMAAHALQRMGLPREFRDLE